jgi:hypothetical protein
MNGEQQEAARRRRTGAEVRQLVAEFVNSGMRRSEFCRSRGLSYSTLDRHLKKRRWKKRTTKSAPADGKFVAVELALKRPLAEQQSSWGLAVVLPGGRRIEVQRDFDVHTFERLMNALEGV